MAPLANAKLIKVGEKQSLLTSSQDATIEREAKRCTQHFARQERYHGIPNHLLAAIATTESGRVHKGLGMALPWPWTANVEGKGYYFKNKAEAISKIRAFQAAGKKSIDVGCMQVNLMHHPDAFASLEQAFDPAKNVAYAAKFLRSNYLDSGNWRSAAQHYHSKSPEKGSKYYAVVERHWKRLAKVLPSDGSTRLAALDAPKREPKRYNSIQVGDVKTSVKVKDVLVIRPKTNSRAAVSELAVADKSTQPIDLKPTKLSGLSSHVAQTGGRVVRTSGPTITPGSQSIFIFQ